MIRIGLTGSIGMGKSTVARMFGELGAHVWDADAAVHRLYAKGGAAVEAIAAKFPEIVMNGEVDRAALAAAVLSDPAELKQLEDIVHPLVAADRTVFSAEAAAAGAPAAVFDIPLLFENGSEAFFDAVVVVSAGEATQRDRVLARPGMTAPKFEAILGQQMPDAEKRARADYVISSDQPMDAMFDDVRNAYEAILHAGRQDL